MRYVIAPFLFLVLSVLCLPPAFGAPVGKPIHALMLLSSPGIKLDAEMNRRLEAAGIFVKVQPFTVPVNQETLRLFDLVVLPDFVGDGRPNFASGIVDNLNRQRNIEALLQYVQDGGGVFVAPFIADLGQVCAEGCDALLVPWGARVLAEQIRDDARKGAKDAYAWTTAITKSPVTEGVERIWYPTNQMRWDDCYATGVLSLDKNWTPLVKGMPGSAAARALRYTTWYPNKKMPQPCIAAIREVGKGRVAVLTVGAHFTFSSPFEKPEVTTIGENGVGLLGGVFLEAGDGTTRSDGQRLIFNMLKWIAAKSQANGFGGYTPEKLAAAPKPVAATVPDWVAAWDAKTVKPFKVLIGARSAYSDGKGTIAEYAAAARKAGYAVLVMTETFEYMKAAEWPKFLRDCEAASDGTLLVLPGIDIQDIYQNRFITFGQRLFPEPYMLSADGKSLLYTQYLCACLGNGCTAIHRSSTTPLPHHLQKFFSGFVVYTYKDGQLADDSLLAYQWQVENESVPSPLVVHEIYSPAELTQSAGVGHQQYVMSDTLQNVKWFMRAPIHLWEFPTRYLISAGPMIRTLDWGRLVADDDVPITEVVLRSHYTTERRWTPNAKSIDLSYALSPSHLRWSYMFLKDAKGRTAISPVLRYGKSMYYNFRCGDRQNFFGYALQYTGATVGDFEPFVPTFGTDEGKGLWPNASPARVQGNAERGENMVALLEFPYTSEELNVTDARLDQRYWKALLQETIYDARPSQGTSRSRVYEGDLRWYDFGVKDDKDGALMQKEVQVRLRMPVEPDGPIFPSFAKVTAQPGYAYRDPQTGKAVTGKLTTGYLDLPVGGCAGDLIALTPLRISADGTVGWAAPAWSNGPFPVGAAWSARFVRVPKGVAPETLQRAMGFTDATPYQLTFSRGAMDNLAYVAYLRTDGYGVAGMIQPADRMPYTLPLAISGVNANWDAAVVRADGAMDDFGVFEGIGRARLDVTKGGAFYAGNIITAGDPRLNLSIIKWDANGITVDINNPTDSPIVTEISTPREVSGKYHLQQQITIQAGSSLQQEFGAGK